jgi:hypothetical protein
MLSSVSGLKRKFGDLLNQCSWQYDPSEAAFHPVAVRSPDEAAGQGHAAVCSDLFRRFRHLFSSSPRVTQPVPPRASAPAGAPAAAACADDLPTATASASALSVLASWLACYLPPAPCAYEPFVLLDEKASTDASDPRLAPVRRYVLGICLLATEGTRCEAKEALNSPRAQSSLASNSTEKDVDVDKRSQRQAKVQSSHKNESNEPDCKKPEPSSGAQWRYHPYFSHLAELLGVCAEVFSAGAAQLDVDAVSPLRAPQRSPASFALVGTPQQVLAQETLSWLLKNRPCTAPMQWLRVVPPPGSLAAAAHTARPADALLAAVLPFHSLFASPRLGRRNKIQSPSARAPLQTAARDESKAAHPANAAESKTAPSRASVHSWSSPDRAPLRAHHAALSRQWRDVLLSLVHVDSAERSECSPPPGVRHPARCELKWQMRDVLGHVREFSGFLSPQLTQRIFEIDGSFRTIPHEQRLPGRGVVHQIWGKDLQRPNPALAADSVVAFLKLNPGNPVRQLQWHVLAARLQDHGNTGAVGLLTYGTRSVVVWLSSPAGQVLGNKDINQLEKLLARQTPHAFVQSALCCWLLVHE